MGAIAAPTRLPGVTAAALTSAAIAAAITAAGVNGRVNLPAGTGALTATITPLAGQRIVGAGKYATKLTVANNLTINAFALSADDVTLEYFQIDGQRAAAAVNLSQTQNAGVYVTGARCSIERCYIHDVLGMGVSATSAAPDLRVEGCRIEAAHTVAAGTTGGVSKGIYCQGSYRPIIRRNTLRGWSQAVGLWYGVLDGLIEGNRITDNYGFEDAAHTVNRSACEDYGANVIPHGRNRWANNLVDGSTHNCFEIAQGLIGTIVQGNVCRNPGKISNDGKCVEVTGQSDQLTTDVIILGNTLESDGTRAGDVGIQTNGYAYRAVIASNTIVGFSGASAYGIFLSEAATVRGNTLYNCNAPIWITASGDGCTVEGNFVEEWGSGQSGIKFANGSAHLVHGNTLRATSDARRGMQLSTGDRHRVTGNRVAIKDSTGIEVATADNLIANNYVENNEAGNNGCIKLTGAAALRNTVQNNVVNSITQRYGITLLASADYNVVQGNTLLPTGAQPVLQSGAGSHNTVEPNHTSTVTKALTPKSLGSQTVGTSQATIAHGLGYTPLDVNLKITMTSAGTIWRSAASDGTNIYLTADSAGRTADVSIR